MPRFSGSPRIETRRLERPRRDVERQPVRRVGRAVGAAGDPEAHPVELPAVQDRRLLGVDPVRVAPIAVVVGEVEPDPRNPPERPPPGQDVVPQLFGPVRVGVLARQADDGDAAHDPARPATPAAGTGSAGSRPAERWAAHAWTVNPA